MTDGTHGRTPAKDRLPGDGPVPVPFPYRTLTSPAGAGLVNSLAAGGLGPVAVGLVGFVGKGRPAVGLVGQGHLRIGGLG